MIPRLLKSTAVGFAAVIALFAIAFVVLVLDPVVVYYAAAVPAPWAVPVLLFCVAFWWQFRRDRRRHSRPEESSVAGGAS